MFGVSCNYETPRRDDMGMDDAICHAWAALLRAAAAGDTVTDAQLSRIIKDAEDNHCKVLSRAGGMDELETEDLEEGDEKAVGIRAATERLKLVHGAGDWKKLKTTETIRP